MSNINIIDENISILKFTRENQLDISQITEVSSLFIHVFAGYPWFEVYKCGNCGKFFNKHYEHGGACPNCIIGTLEDAYTMKEMADAISELLNKPDAIIFLVFNQGYVDGFAWGYSESLADATLKFDESVRLFISNKLEEMLQSSGKTRIYKISEIGLNETLRYRGFGRILFECLLSEIENLDAVAVVWTRKDTRLNSICLKSGFTVIFGPELTIENGEIIETGTVAIGVDKDTPERVFYAK